MWINVQIDGTWNSKEYMDLTITITVISPGNYNFYILKHCDILVSQTMSGKLPTLTLKIIMKSQIVTFLAGESVAQFIVTHS